MKLYCFSTPSVPICSSGSFSIVGKKIDRVAPGEFVADQAEYTTCQDCPESWSVFGQKVRVYQDQYVHIKHALLKVNRVTIMYMPYFIFPIKKGRQTGLLSDKQRL